MSHQIELEGVAVHNLRDIDVTIPHYRLVAVCGVSGSGKTSLALDTLYAEGQRRYIESFSAYTRQFLERLEKPQAERIAGLPPAIAVTHKNSARSSRATVGTSTEIVDYLRLLYARVGKVICHACGVEVRRDSPESAAAYLNTLPDGTRYMLTFPVVTASRPANGLEESEDDRPEQSLDELAKAWQEDGFIRWIVDGKVRDLTTGEATEKQPTDVQIVVDRLVAGKVEMARLRDSLETALAKGDGRCRVYIALPDSPASSRKNGDIDGAGHADFDRSRLRRETLDEQSWWTAGFSDRLTCEDCGRDYPKPEPKLFSFNSPLGACPTCEGFGNTMEIDMELVVPDPSKSLSEGAIAPWNTPSYAHELAELLALADDFDLPRNTPYRDLTKAQKTLIREGVPEREFGGLDGFFQWLERRKYKMHIRVFLSRWRSYRTCPSCGGSRLRQESLATQVGGRNLAELCRLKIRDAIHFFRALELEERDQSVAQMLLQQVSARLGYLDSVGLGYLSLDRTLRTLSGGEAQRVALTSALGSSLVNMLYVLDEPSVGLHPHDMTCLVTAIEGLRDRGNTVVMVDHEEAMIGAADHVIEIGPGAGADGGRVTFEGSPESMRVTEGVLTGDFLSGRRGSVVPESRREPTHGWVRLNGACGNNLKNVNAEFPLGLLCLVTGVSGSGKSSLVEQTLFPAIARRKRKEAEKPLPFEDLLGDGQLDEVVMIDQSPIGRSPRSNPVTYIKAFDAIRSLFAETLAARTRNFKASHFSFNVDGGRCDTCQGDGYVQIDMQFLADVMMRCSSCQGRRYRRDVLDITYRGRNISEVLEMTVRQAHSFFRGQSKIQSRLQPLVDVGLDYLQLGQAANTLSAGEAQRLKLAGFLASPRRGRTLFLLDEPTTGLHFADIVQLLDCFDALIEAGHSLIVVEHNPQMMLAADYIVDLGPGASDEGGRIVVSGTPEQVAKCQESPTGQVLAKLL